MIADDDVGALPHAEPSLAVGVPDALRVGAVDRPPREVHERERHRPDREAPDEAADEPDRPEQREDERAGAEDERPQPLRTEAEELVGERSGGRRDHEQLEDRPADALQHVDPRRQERPALSERSAHQRHARHARVGADHPGDGDHRIPDDAADDDRDERCGERQRRHENGAGHDHEQRHAEVPPQEPRFEPAEHVQSRRDRVDPPAALDGLRVGHQTA